MSGQQARSNNLNSAITLGHIKNKSVIIPVFFPQEVIQAGSFQQVNDMKNISVVTNNHPNARNHVHCIQVQNELNSR